MESRFKVEFDKILKIVCQLMLNLGSATKEKLQAIKRIIVNVAEEVSVDLVQQHCPEFKIY